MIQPCAGLDEQAVPIDTLIHGDALAVLKTFPDNCIDAICVDPPAGISFMNMGFDHHRGGRDLWIAWLRDIMAEAMRALKPGGHAFVWALPRTSHWTATALEDAGFEIRDVVSHVFSTGMPKSLDISKAIDKEAGKEREVIGKKDNKSRSKAIYGGGLNTVSDYDPITAPATPESQRHVGVGTGIKPAHENWILCRKPISERTIAANVLRWGVGGLNIDKTRIGTRIDTPQHRPASAIGIGHGTACYGTRDGKEQTYTAGRWPANFLLSHTLFCTPAGCADGCPVKLLDEQSGIRKSGGRVLHAGQEMPLRFKTAYREGSAVNHEAYELHPSEGTASRFFQTFPPDPFIYQSKPSRRERSAGCEELPAQNNHPTLKSIALMRYLIRMITPDGGIVLDCFAGSGSTLVAAIREGVHFIGIEEDDDYVTIARARIAHEVNEKGYLQ